MSPPELNAKIVLKATVSPSEDPEKVSRALKNIVGEAKCDVTMDPYSVRLVSEDSKALVRIRDQLRDRHVRSAARRHGLCGRLREPFPA